jgi:CDP-diacylglycerol--glycerol-3-phosphate 3-phosphatidyltransferase
MNTRSLPNFLALFRILATAPLIWLISLQRPSADLGAALLLLIIAISDVIDGPLARRLGVVSPLGIFLDTISDKIFVAGALIPMVERGMIWAWVAVLIVARDYLVSALRSYAAAKGQIIPARKWGKQKMILTMAALIWLQLKAHADQGGVLATIPFFSFILDLAPYVLGLAVIWTIGSGAEYIIRAWPMLRRDWAPPQQRKATPLQQIEKQHPRARG